MSASPEERTSDVAKNENFRTLGLAVKLNPIFISAWLQDGGASYHCKQN